MEYMNWLKNKYGNTNLSGFKLVSEILEDYSYPVNMMKIYKESISNNLKSLTVSQKTKRFLNIIFSKNMKIIKVLSAKEIG